MGVRGDGRELHDSRSGRVRLRQLFQRRGHWSQTGLGARLDCLRETGLILRWDRKVGNPFQTKQGSRPSCGDQEGRRGSEEVVAENFGVPLEGDRDVGALCGSHQGWQVPFRTPIPKVGLLLRRCSGKGIHLAMTWEPRGQKVSSGFSIRWDGKTQTNFLANPYF